MQFPDIPPINEASAAMAAVRQQQLTKPAGSLGRLEALSIQLAGITGQERPRFHHKTVIIMAADHGVALDGVSAYPPEVTAQMVSNFLHGGAAINVLARQTGASVRIVDIGVAQDFPAAPGLLQRKIAYGTQNMHKGPAMTREQAEQSLEIGMHVAHQAIDEGADLIATGEMGIGNTTPSSAITAVLCGLPVEQVTGRGTGLDDAALQQKIAIIKAAIQTNHPRPEDALDVLAKMGGFEIGGLAGVMISAASRHVPVVVDGFISAAAALIAVSLVPQVRPYLIASHQSREIGQRAIWNFLGLEPLLDLDLRLGEGSGAALAFHLIEAATGTLDEMATFAEAGVSDKA